MRTHLLGALCVLIGAALPARAAVVVIGNFTTEPVAFSVAEPDAKSREHKLAANHVAPVYVTGPADITFNANGRATTLRLDVYNAYVFLPDAAAGLRLEGLELPGEALEGDGRAEMKPAPRDPVVKVPVTLLVDDADPRADKLWQAELRKRFDEAAAVIESASGIRLEFAGFDTWKSDADATNMTDLFTNFETVVKVKPGALAVGYSSRKLNEKAAPAFGMTRGGVARHVLAREGRPKSEAERVEVLVHYLAKALGAVGTPDPSSALRDKLGDGYVQRADSVMRLDPLNALALNIWAEERRLAPDVTLATLSPVGRHRLARVYKALLKASPDDFLAVDYANAIDRDTGKKDPARTGVKLAARDEAVRKVVKAVADRAKANTGPGALTGDELTAALVREAAATAGANEGPEKVPAFLIGLGVALDDTGALANDAITASAVKNVESADERKVRVAALGNPTLGGRRDLCRRFFLGCAVGELLPTATAESAAVGRALFDLHKPTGLCVPALAAEFAGSAFARAVQANPELIRDAFQKVPSFLPPLTGLRDGLSVEKFEELYGDSSDVRFEALLADVRKRIKELKVQK